MNTNLARYLERIAGAVRGSWIARGRNWLLADSGIASDTFNKLLLTGADTELDAALAATETLRSDGRPYTVWLTPEALSGDIPAQLKTEGFIPVEVEEGIVLALDHAIEARETDLEIRRVSDLEEMNDVAMILAANWNPPDVHVQNYYRLAAANLLENPDIVFFIGYADGEAVTCLHLCLHDSIAGLYSMATLAAHRGKGYARAILVDALNWARLQGARRAVLQASADGEPVCRKLGFEPMGRYEEWQFFG